jgi:hypothetical protein
MAAMTTNESMTNELFEKAVNKGKYYLPLYLLVPAAFWIGFHYSGIAMNWQAFGLGALGWIIALFLRGPLSAIVMKLPKEKAQTIVVASSGFIEECVRLAILLITGLSFSWSLSLGQGWAAVEVLFVIINVIVLRTLVNRTDEKAMQAKEMLKLQGNLSADPMWGVVERIFATAFHIGCTLLAAKYSWTLVLLIPLHSFVNLSAVKLAKKSIAAFELTMAVIGTITLIIGLIVFQ